MAENSSDNWPGQAVGTGGWPGQPVGASTPQENLQPTMLDEAVRQKQQEAVSGFKRGIAGGIGLPGDVTKFIGDTLRLEDKDRALPTSEEVLSGMEKLGIEKPKGKSDKVIEFLSNPLSYLGGGSVLSKVLGAGGAGVGAETGERIGGTPGEVVGAVTGGVLPQSVLGKGKALGFGLATPAERKVATDYLESRPIPVEVSAGQQTGNMPLRRTETQFGQAILSGDKTTQQTNRQMRQFTANVLAEAGEKGELANPETVDMAFSRIGKEFDRLQANSMFINQDLKDAFAKSNQEYERITTQGTKSPYPERLAQAMAGASVGQSIPGDIYKGLRTEINATMRKTTDPSLKNVLHDYQDALDEAMESTLAHTNPHNLGAWKEARRQYRNLLVIERAATRGGEAAAEGLITPENLRQSLIAVQGRRAYARGFGDLAKLSRAGNLVLTRPKSSGTAENLFTMKPSSMIAGLLGRGLYNPQIQALLKSGRLQTPIKGVPPSYPIRALVNTLGDQNASQ